MDNRDFSDIGEQIRRTVESALGSQNFEQLNKNISDSVTGALEEVRKSLTGTYGKSGKQSGGQPHKSDKTSDHWKIKPEEQIKKKEYTYSRCRYSSFENPKRESPNQGSLNWENANQKGSTLRESLVTSPTEASKLPESVRVNYPSRVAGILYTIFGSIGIGVSGIVLFVVLLVSSMAKPIFGSPTGLMIFLLILSGAFGFMLGVGRGLLKKIKRLKNYLKEAGDKTYCQIEQLSAAVGKPARFVIKDLERMIGAGILPEARLDDKKTCLMLDKATYTQYLETQRGFAERKKLQQEDAKRQTQRNNEENNKKNDSLSGEIRQMIETGKGYVRILREANDAIPGEHISAKLSKLETVISLIFETVEKHPEQIGEMERFMDYYLPTTVKLVNAYRDFDSVNMAGGNVETAKQEIENTLDTINQAFESLLDNLYADAALDASTDASVLQTMLKQDGFGGSDFK